METDLMCGDVHEVRREMLARCETMPKADAARALQCLLRLYDDPVHAERLRSLLEVGELSKRLHDAARLSPKHRRLLWARECDERGAEEAAHQERVDRIDTTRKLRARHLAQAELTYRRMRRSWRPFRRVKGVEGKILRTRDLRVVTPSEWMALRLRTQPTSVRLALTHKIHAFAREHGWTHVPPSVISALADAFQQFGEADLIRPQSRFYRALQYLNIYHGRAQPVPVA